MESIERIYLAFSVSACVIKHLQSSGERSKQLMKVMNDLMKYYVLKSNSNKL